MKKSKLYIKEIDGLRFLAVISVILYHLNENFIPNGFLGVDIFFVVSGFVITTSLKENFHINPRRFFLDFYLRRFKRLLPALIFFVSITFILISIVDPDPKKDFITGFFSLFGVSNLYLMLELNNYFVLNNVFNPFVHTWSLGVEEQFYLVYPFIFWLISKQKLPSYFMIFIFFFSFLIWIFTKNYPEINFYSPFTRIWEIGFGCSIYWLRGLKINTFFQYLFFLCILLCLFIDLGYPYFNYPIIVLSTGFLILTIQEKTMISDFLSNDIVVYLGKISYSTYLWHWGLISIFSWTIGIDFFTIFIILVLTYSMSVLSYELIELPFRRKKITPKKLTYLSVPLIIIFFFKFSNISNYIYHDDKNYYLENKESHPPNESFIKVNRKNSNRNILIIGDSHAGHLNELMNQLSAKLNFSYYLHIRGQGLPFKIESDNTHYFNFLVEPFEYYYDKLNEEDIVVISIDYRFEKIKEDVVKAYEKIINRNKKLNLIFIDQTPYVINKKRNFNNVLCKKTVLRPYAKKEECISLVSKKELLKRKFETTKYLINLSKIDNVYYYDPFNSLCPEEECSNYRDNFFIYKDSDHLTKKGSLLLEDDLKHKLKIIWDL